MTHEGWLVSLRVLGAELGAQPEIDDLPLLGVSADRVDHDGTIAISVARPIGDHFTHIVRDVVRLHVERATEGATAGLLIESADGTRTILQSGARAPPRGRHRREPRRAGPPGAIIPGRRSAGGPRSGSRGDPTARGTVRRCGTAALAAAPATHR
jgi:hypothetical protein